MIYIYREREVLFDRSDLAQVISLPLKPHLVFPHQRHNEGAR